MFPGFNNRVFSYTVNCLNSSKLDWIFFQGQKGRFGKSHKNFLQSPLCRQRCARMRKCTHTHTLRHTLRHTLWAKQSFIQAVR